jgi:hypothetical protein
MRLLGDSLLGILSSHLAGAADIWSAAAAAALPLVALGGGRVSGPFGGGRVAGPL